MFFEDWVSEFGDLPRAEGKEYEQGSINAYIPPEVGGFESVLGTNV
jgi:hypothetical protein